MILPACVKVLLSKVDGSDNFKVKTVQRQCIITKDGSTKGMRPFSYVVRPWEIVEQIVEKIKVEGSYKPSQDWMAAQDKCVVTINADKGSDLNLSLRCANKEGGNLMNDTYCAASVGGPICECIETEMETIFNDKYPIRRFLQGVLDQSYFILIIVTSNNQCRSIVFQPTPKPERVCSPRTIGVKLLDGHIEEESDDVIFYQPVSDTGGLSVVSIPTQTDYIEIRLVRKEDDPTMAVGVQFIVQSEVAHTKRFHSPLSLKGVQLKHVKSSAEQVIGFPPNDGKQQLICVGIPSNSCRYACPSCTYHRDAFGNWSERLWNAAVRMGLKSGEWPNKNVTMREGYWSFQNCLERYNDKTNNGIFPIAPSKVKELSTLTASVSKPIGLSVWHLINCGDVMHLSSGMINRTMSKIRKKLRKFEEESEFIVQARNALAEVNKMLPVLELTIRKAKTLDKNIKASDSIMIPLHKEGERIQKRMNKLLDEAKGLELALHYNEGCELEGGEYVSYLDVQKSSEQLEKEIELYRTKAREEWKMCKEHAETSGYDHYLQLHAGLLLFKEGLTMFLSGSSKKPHGKLEFVFNNALEHVGGGLFSAENGGFDQTNGRAMNSLEKFDDVADVCVRAYESSDPIYEEGKQMFDGYRLLAKTLFEVTKYMKSQKKQNVDEFVKLLVQFLAKYEELFPGERCFNKLHFVMWHLVEFIAEWETCGRLSAESHESVHTAFEKAKAAVRCMASTNQMYNTIFARMTLDLKNNIAELKKKVRERGTSGKARGKYKTNNVNKRQDEVDTVSTSFSQIVTHDDEEFIELPCDGDRIHKKYIDRFVYCATGRAPTDWTQCFAESKMLSEAKLEQARYATYQRVST